jgi:putative ABC transport system ATP-binding protein
MIAGAIPHAHPHLSVRKLCHAFGAGALRQEILRGLDADFHAGELAMILGPSGSGKTTLLNLAGTLRAVQTGSVRLDGVELKGAGREELARIRRGIGFVFQTHKLLASLNCLENVMVALVCEPRETPASAREKALAALRQVGLPRAAAAWPADLSQGERLRVAVARAIVRGPGIILADEPTASLDRANGRVVVDLLQEHAHQHGAAVLVVTHDPRIQDAADRIYLLDAGRLVPNPQRGVTASGSES